MGGRSSISIALAPPKRLGMFQPRQGEPVRVGEAVTRHVRNIDAVDEHNAVGAVRIDYGKSFIRFLAPHGILLRLVFRFLTLIIHKYVCKRHVIELSGAPKKKLGLKIVSPFSRESDIIHSDIERSESR